MLFRALTLAAFLTGAFPAMADAVVHAVINIDLMPRDQASGTKLLTGYVRELCRDPVVEAVTLVRQAGSTNHFILIQTFATRAAYGSHGEADYVRSFRSALHPYLGSPSDERSGDDITR